MARVLFLCRCFECLFSFRDGGTNHVCFSVGVRTRTLQDPTSLHHFTTLAYLRPGSICAVPRRSSALGGNDPHLLARTDPACARAWVGYQTDGDVSEIAFA